ncbi:MAG: hypothetical protein JRD05_10865 [Deltaproteobacteria bacterium]|nr:hypothetical protein [Deltaproteobacteria bacterium]
MRKYFNGLILFFWLCLSILIGTLGWIVIESYTNAISSSKSYVDLLNQFSTQFTLDGIEFRNKDDMLAYIEKKEGKPKSVSGASETAKFTLDGIEFRNKDDMLAYIEKKKGKSKSVSDASETAKFTLDGIEFKNKQALEVYVKTSGKKKLREKFSIRFIVNWVEKGGSSQGILITVLTAFSFGVIGCIIDIFKKLIYDDEKLENVRIFLSPLFSGLVAFMILGIAELIPVVFQANTDANVVRPVSLFFFCLFGGIMAERIFTWARNLVADFLKIKFED